jgi:hypothetical protein
MKNIQDTTSGINTRNVQQRIFSGLSRPAWIMILLFAFISWQCKKDTFTGETKGICPEVVSTDPANGATNVITAKIISAVFNEPMDASTINQTTFKLRQGTAVIAGTVTYTGITATFTPVSVLTANTVYTATISKEVRDPAGNSMIADYTWSFNTGAVPIVVSTDPANGATNVAINKIVTATFSTNMNPATINGTTFVLKQGSVIVPGVVTYSGMTATFTPAAPFTPSTLYTGTITTGAKDIAGNALAADYVWSFATGSLPTVVATDPTNGATAVPLNKVITATFSTTMDPTTINNTTFLLKQGVNSITGTVSYSGTTASFTPTSALLPNTVYTATITNAVKNTAGNAMAANYTWSFTTVAAIPPPPPPPIGAASIFGVFGGSAGITNQGVNTVINNGSIGTIAASTLITGFHDGTTGDIYTETPLNIGLVTGRIHTAPPPPGSAASFQIATAGLLAANNTYQSISPANRPGGTDPGAGELGGLTLPPGVYKSASGTFNISSGNLTLDAMGNPNAEWIFQTAAGLTVGVAGPTGAKSVLLINGGQAKNVYWYVGSAATINGAGGGVMTGTIISSAGITFSTAGNTVQTVLNGRAISLNASVTLVNTTINVPN